LSFDAGPLFENSQTMEKMAAVEAFAGLGSAVRVDALRLLAQAHPRGLTAAELADALKVNLGTFYFHLEKLRQAGLITTRGQRPETFLIRAGSIRALAGFIEQLCQEGLAGLGQAEHELIGSG
jgi:ArsR family transcriptional regulator